MSNAVLPAYVGIKLDAQKAPIWSTRVAEATSGFERRVQQTVYPLKWSINLTVEVLRDQVGLDEAKNLLGFFNQRGGRFDSFLYTDPDDNAVTGYQFGLGDGATTQFQLLRPIGTGSYAFAEPVNNLNGIPSVFVGGVLETLAQLTSPAAPSLSQVAGGALAATTYFVKTAYVDANGQETLASAEASLAVSLNNLLQIASPAAQTGAVGWNVYVSTASGTETRQNGAAPIAIGTGWAEPTSGLVVGASLPAANKTGYSLSSTGLVTFNGAPANGAALTWTGSYYWRVRFDDDRMPFNKIFQSLWELKKLPLIGSVMNKV